MTGVVSVAVSVSIFMLTLLCFSLRDFSRSRLEEICKKHDRLKRFGSIMRGYQKALLLGELLLMMSIVVCVWTAARTGQFASLDVPIDSEWTTWAQWALRALAVVCGIALFFVALPWTISRVRGESLLYVSWPILSGLGKVATPVWRFSVHLDQIVHRVFGVPEPNSEEAAKLLTDELLTVVDESRREGVIQSNASTMIHRVVDLQTEDVAAIMTPRTDMVTIDADVTLSDAMDEMLENGFSRVPVIRDGIDDIVGILYARDLLAYSNESNGDSSENRSTAADLARDVLYAPESQGIGDLLEAMRQQKVHMAIIVDEYSGVSGLVTLEDILEEIVGDIADEYDSEDDSLWKEHRDGRTDVDARYHLDDLNEEFGYDFPEDEEFDTIGGFVLSCFGRIPATGEEYSWQNLKLIVIEADERHLIRVRIEGPAAGTKRNQRSA